MTYSEAIKGGFRLINSKWQLVAVQAAMMLLKFLGFFVMVIIPLGIAFVMFGIDLTILAETRDIMSILRNPADLMTKYVGLFIFVVVSFMFYIVLTTTLWLYVLGGSVGIIGISILDSSFKFSMRSLFSEARKLFFPMMKYALLIGLIFIAIAFAFGLFGGIITALLSLTSGQDATLGLFFKWFFRGVLAFSTICLLLLFFIVALCGIAVLTFRQEGSFKALKDAVRFLWNNEGAFWLFLIISVVYLCTIFVIAVISYPFILIPVISVFVSFPLELLSSYLFLVFIAIIFTYYHDAELKPSDSRAGSSEGTNPPAGESPGATEGSTQVEGTSLAQGPGQGTVPPETEGPEQT